MFLEEPIMMPNIQNIIPGKKINREIRYCIVRKEMESNSGSLRKMEKSDGNKNMRRFNNTKNAAKKLRE